ncbi:MarR family winged helix-turn-helix transcriptional regulator [Streptomyces sp. L7]
MPTTPRWLDAEERRAWLAYVEFSTHLSDHLNRQLRRDAGLTLRRLHPARPPLLAPGPGSDHVGAGRATRITRSRLTHAVTRLQQAGYVDRRDDPANRRNQLAVLTEEGASCWSGWRPAMSRPFGMRSSTR